MLVLVLAIPNMLVLVLSIPNLLVLYFLVGAWSSAWEPAGNLFAPILKLRACAWDIQPAGSRVERLAFRTGDGPGWIGPGGIGHGVVHIQGVKSDVPMTSSNSDVVVPKFKKQTDSNIRCTRLRPQHLFPEPGSNKRSELESEITPSDVELDQAHVVCAAVRG